ncbi:hypothetical protein [Rhizobium sp. Root482]|uniref:hypothetical protein n=1 Tax=Rhizobium sp. Root482 TaxID=1736543 RepID=UPI0006FC9FC5|nr:hypothetical protein [Rhizobium sp. Root482]KQY21544.1 hypothetical protein ASD31_23090 [Rhizobium sp. Root482]
MSPQRIVDRAPADGDTVNLSFDAVPHKVARDVCSRFFTAGSSPQEHLWRAKIVLMSDGGLGTVAIMEATAEVKPSRLSRRCGTFNAYV